MKSSIDYSNKINHLTEEQLSDLMHKYYEGISAKVLIEEFRLDLRPGERYIKHFR